MLLRTGGRIDIPFFACETSHLGSVLLTGSAHTTTQFFEVNLHVIPDHPSHRDLPQYPTTAKEDRKHWQDRWSLFGASLLDVQL